LDYCNHQLKTLFLHCNQAETNWQELLKHYKKEVKRTPESSILNKNVFKVKVK